MIKLIYSDSFDEIVGIQARLIEDPRELNKSASTIFGCDYDEIKPDKDHVGIHLVGLGDYESYGPNRNADAFSKHANEKYGQTFLDGHVFRHHNNKNPENAIGSIVKVAHNDIMGRMELFIHAHKDKAAPELERLEKDGEHPFSMACKVPYDRCSRCNTLRKTTSDPSQCDHVKYDLGKMAEDGKLTFVFNDQPKYFDMSFVTRPADRIAYSLKIASDGGVMFIDSVTLAKEAGLWVPEHILIESKQAQAKRTLFNKLAEFEIFYRNSENNLKNSRNFKLWELRKAACSNIEDKTIEQLRDYAPEVLFVKLADSFIVLPFTSFCKYAFGVDYSLIGAELVKEAGELISTGVYSYLDTANEYADVCNDGYFDYPVPVSPWSKAASIDIINDIRQDVGMLTQEAEHRAINATLAGQNPKVRLIKSATYSNEAIALAEKYASYKLSMLNRIFSKHPEADETTILALSVAQDLFN